MGVAGLDFHDFNTTGGTFGVFVCAHMRGCNYLCVFKLVCHSQRAQLQWPVLGLLFVSARVCDGSVCVMVPCV